MQQKEAFKVRWFCLDSQERNLLYFKNPLVRGVFFDPQPLCGKQVGRKGLFSSTFSSGCARLEQAQPQEPISLAKACLWSWAGWELWPVQWLWERSSESNCYCLWCSCPLSPRPSASVSVTLAKMSLSILPPSTAVAMGMSFPAPSEHPPTSRALPSPPKNACECRIPLCVFPAGVTSPCHRFPSVYLQILFHVKGQSSVCWSSTVCWLMAVCFLLSRMHLHRVRFSSEGGMRDMKYEIICPRKSGWRRKSQWSLWSHQWESLCLSVRMTRSRGNGWMPWTESSPNPDVHREEQAGSCIPPSCSFWPNKDRAVFNRVGWMLLTALHFWHNIKPSQV